MIEAKEKELTIRDHIINDHRKTQVFRKHGLDFCCGGNNTIENACAEIGLDPIDVYRDLEHIEQSGIREEIDQNAMRLTDLIEYIMEKHHRYINEQAPEIMQHLKKIVNVHGSRHPQLERIYHYFQDICSELIEHMQKEEVILFPYIQELEEHKDSNTPMSSPPFETVQNPIDMMEHEHTEAGDQLRMIRQLTNNFTAPEDACMTFQATYKYLEEFEADLHEHIHTENNILFPKALEMERNILIG